MGNARMLQNNATCKLVIAEYPIGKSFNNLHGLVENCRNYS